MSMKRLLIMLALAGCTQPETDSGAQPVLGDATEESCGLTEAEALVGQDKSAAGNLAHKGPIRVIGPGPAVTTDFSPSRLNIDYDDAGKITRVWCG